MWSFRSRSVSVRIRSVIRAIIRSRPMKIIISC
jgi:hypothetical protein